MRQAINFHNSATPQFIYLFFCFKKVKRKQIQGKLLEKWLYHKENVVTIRLEV